MRSELGPVIAAHICLHAAMTGARMAAPLFALGHGYGKAAAGVLVALFAATQIFLSLPAGRFADRNGLKKPVRLSVVVTSLGVGLAAIWPVFPVLCVTALLCGGAVGAATIALQRHVGRMAASPRELRQVFAWISVAPAASGFLGPLAAGLMIDHGGYRPAFALLAALPLLAGVLLLRVRELPIEGAPAGQKTAAWDLLRDPGLRRLLIMNWFMNSSWDLHGFMVPLLGHERGLPASVIGSILGSFAIGAAIVRVLIPVFARRVREWALITGATAVAGLGFLLYPFTPSAATMGLCSVAIGAALGLVQPMVMSMLHQITPRHRHGEALAVRLILVNLSSVGMPMMFGAVGGVLGASGVFWAMGTIIGVGSHLGTGLRHLGEDAAEP
ncbi:MFS transporter [Rhodoferax sediminis]